MKKENGRGLEALARKGRGGDTEIGHLTEGELVVPISILGRFPEARDALFEAFREAGIDPDRYIVGEEENSVNPETGAREFFSPGSDDKFGRDGNAFDGGYSGGPPGGQEGGGGGNSFPSGLGGGQQMTLPPEYADFITEDGRRLEDVLGKSFFEGGGKLGGFGGGIAGLAMSRLLGGKGKRGKRGVHARVLAERQAQAKRLNQTKSILTGPQGVEGAVNTSRKDLSGG